MRAPIAFLHPSNLLTYTSIAAASYAALAVQGPGARALAGLCVGLSAISDAFDGRFARQFERTEEEKRFGGQIDSLADALAFGLAPAVAITRIALPTDAMLGLRLTWYFVALFYVVCAVTRLAFFNLTVDDAGHDFVGVPTTVIGLSWCCWLLFPMPWWASLVAMGAFGYLMVAPIPIKRPGFKVGLVLFSIAVSACIVHTWRVLQG